MLSTSSPPDPAHPGAPGHRGPLVGVDDPDDARLELYRNLNDPTTSRHSDAGVVVVEGRLAVERLLRSTYAVRSLLVDDHQVAAVGATVEAVRARGAPVYVGTRAVVASTVGFALHRGVVAMADRPPAGDARTLVDGVSGATTGGHPALVAVLEGLNDHENIGALFRNAAAFGVAGVLLDPTCADPLYRRSVRVSVGHVLHLPFARIEPWPAGLRLLRRAGFLIAALAPHHGEGGRPVVDLTRLGAMVRDDRAPAGVA
ncbi:MAG: TrmH family RNA methyltransferase, partial [Acidimicrobiales bacterium]